MKRTSILIVLLAFAANIFSQTVIKNQEYYLAKSKRQKSAAYTMLIGGAVAIGIGFLIGDNKNASFDDAATGGIIGGIGILSMGGSIPLFLASGKNKRKASLVINTRRTYFNPLTSTNKKMVHVGIIFPI